MFEESILAILPFGGYPQTPPILWYFSCFKCRWVTFWRLSHVKTTLHARYQRLFCFRALHTGTYSTAHRVCVKVKCPTQTTLFFLFARKYFGKRRKRSFTWIFFLLSHVWVYVRCTHHHTATRSFRAALYSCLLLGVIKRKVACSNDVYSQLPPPSFIFEKGNTIWVDLVVPTGVLFRLPDLNMIVQILT